MTFEFGLTETTLKSYTLRAKSQDVPLYSNQKLFKIQEDIEQNNHFYVKPRKKKVLKFRLNRLSRSLLDEMFDNYFDSTIPIFTRLTNSIGDRLLNNFAYIEANEPKMHETGQYYYVDIIIYE